MQVAPPPAAEKKVSLSGNEKCLISLETEVLNRASSHSNKHLIKRNLDPGTWNSDTWTWNFTDPKEFREKFGAELELSLMVSNSRFEVDRWKSVLGDRFRQSGEETEQSAIKGGLLGLWQFSTQFKSNLFNSIISNFIRLKVKSRSLLSVHHVGTAETH